MVCRVKVPQLPDLRKVSLYDLLSIIIWGGDSEPSGQCSKLIPLGFRERQVDSSGGSVSREEAQ